MNGGIKIGKILEAGTDIWLQLVLGCWVVILVTPFLSTDIAFAASTFIVAALMKVLDAKARTATH